MAKLVGIYFFSPLINKLIIRIHCPRCNTYNIAFLNGFARNSRESMRAILLLPSAAEIYATVATLACADLIFFSADGESALMALVGNIRKSEGIKAKFMSKTFVS